MLCSQIYRDFEGFPHTRIEHNRASFGLVSCLLGWVEGVFLLVTTVNHHPTTLWENIICFVQASNSHANPSFETSVYRDKWADLTHWLPALRCDVGYFLNGFWVVIHPYLLILDVKFLVTLPFWCCTYTPIKLAQLAGKWALWRWISYSECGYSIAMLVYRRVRCSISVSFFLKHQEIPEN